MLFKHIQTWNDMLCYVMFIYVMLFNIWNFPQNTDDEHYMSMGITIHNYLHMNIRKAKKRPAAARLYGAGTHGGVWRGRPQRLSTVPRR